MGTHDVIGLIASSADVARAGIITPPADMTSAPGAVTSFCSSLGEVIVGPMPTPTLNSERSGLAHRAHRMFGSMMRRSPGRPMRPGMKRKAVALTRSIPRRICGALNAGSSSATNVPPILGTGSDFAGAGDVVVLAAS